MPAHFQQVLLTKAALGAALAVSCLAAPGFVHAATVRDGAAGSDAAMPTRKMDKQVSVAERDVVKHPQDASLRAKLGQTYLAAGRFASAGATFEDAVSLGDKTPGTALAMALAYIAEGRNGEATALLGQWGDALPAGDHGLALALAGQPADAVTMLTAAIKQGENTPKLRQNLAYAYALGGHLAEARVIAAQDVPLDQLDSRVSAWALAASVGSQQSRVAALLGAPIRSDPGRPEQLALATSPERPVLAEVPVAPAPSDAELPAMPNRAPMQNQAPFMAQAEAEAAPATVQLAAVHTSEPEVADIAEVMRRYEASKTSHEAAPRKAVPSAVAAVRARHDRRLASAKAPAPATTGTHAVQLGSFLTEAGAHRAWNIFVSRDPSLKGREMRITEAMVAGRRYFRVAAAGYQAAEARSKCSALKGRGSECLAFATKPAVHGNVPQKGLAPQLARR